MNGKEETVNISGKLVAFKMLTGEIVKSNKYTKTYFDANHSHNHSSNYSSSNVNISSDVDTIHEIFVKLGDSNKELPVKLHREDILVREGNKIALLYVTINNVEYLTTLYNYTTEERYTITKTYLFTDYFIPFTHGIAYFFMIIGIIAEIIFIIWSLIVNYVNQTKFLLSYQFYLILTIILASIVVIIKQNSDAKKSLNAMKIKINELFR